MGQMRFSSHDRQRLIRVVYNMCRATIIKYSFISIDVGQKLHCSLFYERDKFMSESTETFIVLKALLKVLTDND